MKFQPVVVRAAIVLAVGILVIGITVWRTYPTKSKRSLLDPNLQYMHCPECMTEYRFDAAEFDQPCRECGSDKGLIPTVVSIKEESAKSPYGKMVALLLPELAAFLGALWFVLRPRAAAPDAEYRYMRCPNCGQKLRYRVTQVGGVGACSRCRRALRFPEGSPREQELDGAEQYESAGE